MYYFRAIYLGSETFLKFYWKNTKKFACVQHLEAYKPGRQNQVAHL